MVNDMSKITCTNIRKSYKGKNVLHGINLELESGKIYGLIGRNGAGKTTLLSIISAQNPASGGEVRLDGDKIWENKKVLERICFSRELPSGVNSLTSSYKIKEYFKIAGIFYKNWDQTYADKLAVDFELDVNTRLSKLSKGMLSAVTIIVALASKCDYTFLDEPVAGLDVIMRDKFYKLLLEEYMETGRTFVISTHIIDEASSVFEDVIIIKDGQLLLQENTEELVSRCVHVSGKESDVDEAVAGLDTYHTEMVGRSKGVTVMLKEGQSVKSSENVSVQSVSLQNLFIALCGD